MGPEGTEKLELESPERPLSDLSDFTLVNIFLSILAAEITLGAGCVGVGINHTVG